MLDFLWQISAFSLLAPQTFSLAFLAESSSLWIASFGWSVLADGMMKFTHSLLVSHGLIVHEEFFRFSRSLDSFEMLEVVNIIIFRLNATMVCKDLPSSHVLYLSLFGIDLLFPALNILWLIEWYLFANFPRHDLVFFVFYLIDYNFPENLKL